MALSKECLEELTMNVEKIVSKLEWLNGMLGVGKDSFIMKELIPSVKANAGEVNRSNVINLIRQHSQIKQLKVQCQYSALCLHMFDWDGSDELFREIIFGAITNSCAS